MSAFDCRRCGACCCNSDENRAEGYAWYVDVDDPRSPLLHRADLRRKFVVLDDDGAPHLRLHDGDRCAALRGRLGRWVTCQIYRHRPAACRRVEAGSPECHRARRERGLEA